MRVTVDLGEQEFKRLQEIAVDERRSLREQAAWLLAHLLSRPNEEPRTDPNATGGKLARNNE